MKKKEQQQLNQRISLMLIDVVVTIDNMNRGREIPAEHITNLYDEAARINSLLQP